MSAGPVEVDLHMPAVTQLWSEFRKNAKTTNDVMLPFLKLFGVEEGNGVSPFARTFDTPSDLIAVLNKFFQPPPSDPRDRQTDGNDDEQLGGTNLLEKKNEGWSGVPIMYVGRHKTSR